MVAKRRRDIDSYLDPIFNLVTEAIFDSVVLFDAIQIWHAIEKCHVFTTGKCNNRSGEFFCCRYLHLSFSFQLHLGFHFCPIIFRLISSAQ